MKTIDSSLWTGVPAYTLRTPSIRERLIKLLGGYTPFEHERRPLMVTSESTKHFMTRRHANGGIKFATSEDQILGQRNSTAIIDTRISRYAEDYIHSTSDHVIDMRGPMQRK